MPPASEQLLKLHRSAADGIAFRKSGCQLVNSHVIGNLIAERPKPTRPEERARLFHRQSYIPDPMASTVWPCKNREKAKPFPAGL
jgi:hypothetical protein